LKWYSKNFEVLKEPLSNFWGNGTTSSSDGMRVKTAVSSLNSSYNPHFGSDKRITIYRFVNDKFYNDIKNYRLGSIMYQNDKKDNILSK
jgi:Transposase and inactivated derivatives, TnpA family